jgi:hypothetical protein
LVFTLWFCAHQGCCGDGTTKDVSGHPDGSGSSSALKV